MTHKKQVHWTRENALCVAVMMVWEGGTWASVLTVPRQPRDRCWGPTSRHVSGMHKRFLAFPAMAASHPDPADTTQEVSEAPAILIFDQLSFSSGILLRLGFQNNVLENSAAYFKVMFAAQHSFGKWFQGVVFHSFLEGNRLKSP